MTAPVTADLLRAWAPPEPAPGGSKHDRGTVLVVGGAASTPGAVLLAGLAALRVGAGRLQLATCEQTAAALGVAVPEAMVTGYDDAVGRRDRAAALVVGPGLVDRDHARDLLGRLLPGLAVPAVVDAVALTVLEPGLATGPLVLTPNDGELAALTDHEGADGAAEVAARFGAVVVHRDAVVAPDGRRFTDSAGGPGLATSGSGDVLAGVIGGLLARGSEPLAAGVVGAHLHAAAGDRLTARHGGPGLLARELLDELPVLLGGLDRPKGTKEGTTTGSTGPF